VPRHPPCALKNLPQKTKDARVHYAVLKLRTEPATTTRRLPRARPTQTTRKTPGHGPNTRRFTAAAAQRATTPTTRIGARSLRTQQRARPAPPHQRFPTPNPRPAPGINPKTAPRTREYSRHAQQHQPTSRRSTHEQPPRNTRPSSGPEPGTTNPTGAAHRASMLLRKEVIQPHLPVRLPCYDFVPIASPTFDDSLPQGVGPSASGVTDFRDVTGGVYKARERIHRSVADLRLLATPTSRGRVADPDPN
jgi:hypothetical protein